jgi:hypothetical protein
MEGQSRPHVISQSPLAPLVSWPVLVQDGGVRVEAGAQCPALQPSAFLSFPDGLLLSLDYKACPHSCGAGLSFCFTVFQCWGLNSGFCRQALYHLSHAPTPFCFSYFLPRVNLHPPSLRSQFTWDYIDMSNHT